MRPVEDYALATDLYALADTVRERRTSQWATAVLLYADNPDACPEDVPGTLFRRTRGILKAKGIAGKPLPTSWAGWDQRTTKALPTDEKRPRLTDQHQEVALEVSENVAKIRLLPFHERFARTIGAPDTRGVSDYDWLGKQVADDFRNKVQKYVNRDRIGEFTQFPDGTLEHSSTLRDLTERVRGQINKTKLAKDLPEGKDLHEEHGQALWGLSVGMGAGAEQGDVSRVPERAEDRLRDLLEHPPEAFLSKLTQAEREAFDTLGRWFHDDAIPDVGGLLGRLAEDSGVSGATVTSLKKKIRNYLQHSD